MMIKQIECLFIFILINTIQIIISKKTEPDYYRYLQQFGYTQNMLSQRLFSSDYVDSSHGSSESFPNEGIRKFQRLYKLPETGLLDEKTKELMQRARCGNPDLNSGDFNQQSIEYSSSFKRRSVSIKLPEDYVTQSNIWPNKHLTWFIEEYPKQQKQLKSHDHIRHIINQSFHDWEKYSELKFTMVETKELADLKIKFHSLEHGDEYPFDGQGATLAHAFYPTNGYIHFDDDEIFTDDYTDETDQYTLRLVAAHEIGHALGLTHSFDENSLMFPMYQQFNSNYNISNDDQQGIQKLYGKPIIELTTKTLSPITSTYSSDILSIDKWCSGDFQTGCEGPDGELYLFKDNHAWRYRARTKHLWDSQPKLIQKYFPLITDTKITACVKSTTGYTYLFRNNHIWKLITHWSVNGPYKLSGKNYPENPRIALLHQNSIYLIRNRLIYRLNEFDYNKELDIHSIDTILNPPPNEFIHSGFTYAKQHYIFTRNHIYIYNSTNGNLLPDYPKPLTNGWFACQTSKLNKKLTTENHHRKPKRPSHPHP